MSYDPMPTTEDIIQRAQELFRLHQTECEYEGPGNCRVDYLLFHTIARLRVLQHLEKLIEDKGATDERAKLEAMYLILAAEQVDT